LDIDSSEIYGKRRQSQKNTQPGGMTNKEAQGRAKDLGYTNRVPANKLPLVLINKFL
jgi:hypothetical protein